MPIYAFRCRECGRTSESIRRDVLPCNCGGVLRRDFRFAFKPPTPAHFNHSVGAYVTNDRDFRDKLKEKSEEASARFGLDVSFAPIDYHDKASVGVTDEGLYETEKKKHDNAL